MSRPGSSRPRMRIQQILVSLLAFTAFVGANGGSTARDLAKSKDVGIFARSQYRQPFGLSYFSRQLQASNLDDLPAWRGRIDPQYKRSFMAPAITQNKCRGNQDCSTSLGRYPYEDYIIDPTGNSAQPVVKVGYPKVSSPRRRQCATAGCCFVDLFLCRCGSLTMTDVSLIAGSLDSRFQKAWGHVIFLVPL
jgi:hypothetical protein